MESDFLCVRAKKLKKICHDFVFPWQLCRYWTRFGFISVRDRDFQVGGGDYGNIWIGVLFKI